MWGAIRHLGLLEGTVVVSDRAGQFRVGDHAACRGGGDVSSPPLTDPDERITRIRFFTRKFRAGGAVQVNEQWRGQRVSREHGIEARPRQFAVAAATCKPFSPDAHDLVVIPAQSLAVDATLVTRRALPLSRTGLSPVGPRQLRLAHRYSFTYWTFTNYSLPVSRRTAPVTASTSIAFSHCLNLTKST